MFRTITRISFMSLVGLSALPASSYAQDQFLSNEGLQKTCQQQADKRFKLGNSAQDKQSQVICRDIALLKQVAQWIEQLKVEPNKNIASKDFDSMLRKELNYVRSELSAGRQVLEHLQIKDGEGLVLEPAQWQMDLNGDGKISPWEKYFFAIVKPGERAFNLSMPNDDPQYYQQHFNLSARFRVDQSDVYWALAYHQFIEGFANLILSFQLESKKNGSMSINMIDQASLTRAHQLIGSGLATSEKMRQSLLAETDDELEWIPNPRQKNHVFPLAMNQEAFDLWGKLLAEFTPLWNGKTVAVAPSNSGGLAGEFAKLCPAGTGLDIAALFNRAPSTFASLKSTQYACTKVDAKHSESNFLKFAQESMSRATNQPNSPEGHFIRYFYWVN